MRTKIITFSLLVLVIIVFFYLVLVFFIQPSNTRNWSEDQSLLADISIHDTYVDIKNIRNFEYLSTTEFIPRYYNSSYYFNDIKTAYFIVEPFSGYQGAAHTFLSFEFNDGRFLAISVEIRKEKGESFSAFKGFLRQYELMYVIADERDVIKLRSNYRNDDVYVYPLAINTEQTRALFIDMLKRAQTLSYNPEFYNTLTNTCTTNIVDHVEALFGDIIPTDKRIFFPAESDRFAYELGLLSIPSSLTTFEEARTYFNINERARRYSGALDFSQKIREPISN